MGHQLWPVEKDARLTVLWDAGLSAALIGADPEIGKTRNAVLGRARRLKLASHKAPGKVVSTKPRKARVSKAKPLVMVFKLQPPRPESAVTFMQLDKHHCRYPLGGPKEPAKFFCGEKKQTGESYCSWHFRITHTSEQRTALRPFIEFRKSA